MNTALLSQLRDEAINRICTPYQPNQAKLIRRARELDLTRSRKDDVRTLWLHVDEEPDFCWPFTYISDSGETRYVLIKGMENLNIPSHMESRVDWVASPADLHVEEYDNVWGGRLSVPNAWNDLVRALRFGYDNMGYITQHAFSIDSHGMRSIFDAHQWVAMRDDQYRGPIVQYPVLRGQHPLPFTVIEPDAVYHKTYNPDGLWRAVRDVEWSWQYLQDLAQNQSGKDPVDQLPLTIWPIHCTRQTFGGSIDPTMWEMALLHAYARDAEQILFFKGLSWAAEHYGIYRTEVQVPGDPHAQPNLTGLQLHEHFDYIVVTGQAMYNCVRRTVEQQHEYIVSNDPSQASKMVVLTDTMSAIPGTEPGGERSFAAMQQQGLRLSTTLEFADELRQLTPA